MAEGSERSLQMLAAALEKEEKGREFYRDAAAKCSNDLAKEIFRILTSEEGVHITRIKQIYTALEGGKKWSHGVEGAQAGEPGPTPTSPRAGTQAALFSQGRHR